LAKKFDAPKVFSDYFLNKVEDAKKQALIDAENKAKETALEAESKKASLEKYAPVVAAKKAYFTTVKATATTTPSGLTYKIVKRAGIKPVDGTFIFTMRVILKTEIYLTVAMKM
jgi:FKBP-type peptidyl-prolyl cis-trans isomerase